MEAPQILSVSVVPARAIPALPAYDWLMGLNAQLLVARYLYAGAEPRTAFGLLRELTFTPSAA